MRSTPYRLRRKRHGLALALALPLAGLAVLATAGSVDRTREAQMKVMQGRFLNASDTVSTARLLYPVNKSVVPAFEAAPKEPAKPVTPKLDRSLKGERPVRVVADRFGPAPREAEPEILPDSVDIVPPMPQTADLPFISMALAIDNAELTLARAERREARELALAAEKVAARKAKILAERAKHEESLAQKIATGSVSTETTGKAVAEAAPQQVALATAYARQESEPEAFKQIFANPKAEESALEEQTTDPFLAEIDPTTPTFRPPLLQQTLIRLGPKDHAWAANKLPANSTSEAQRRCLAIGIYFEARGEPVKGQQAVAQVILNRVKNPAYPNTICGVVYQNKHMRNACQFSFTCDGIRDRVRSQRHWKIAQSVADDAVFGRFWLKSVGSSTHYHADYVWPRWRRSMKRLTKIGRHIFYRTYGGGWS